MGTRVTSKVIDKDRGWNRIQAEVKKADKAKTKVGILNTSGDQEGTPLVTIAASNEFGTRNIPERPFVRGWFDSKLKDITRFAKSLYNGIIDGRYTAGKAIKLLGVFGVGGMKKYTIDLRTPPNSLSTIAKKGSSNPLIDTGRLVNSINSEENIK